MKTASILLACCLCLLQVEQLIARPWLPQDDAKIKTAREDLNATPSELNELRKSNGNSSRNGVPEAAQYCIDAELLRIHEVTGIDDQTFIKLRTAAQKDVAYLTKIFGDDLAREFRFPYVTDTQAIEQLWKRAEALLTEPAQEKLKTYISHARQSFLFEAENGTRGALMILENRLSLTPDQIDQLGKLLATSWEEHWNVVPVLALFNQPNYLNCVLEELDQSELNRILTADQQKVAADLNMCFRNNLFQPSDADRDKARESMQFRMKLEIQRLKSIFQVSDDQTARLELAAKGVVIRTIVPSKDRDPYAHPREPAIYRLTGRPLWKKTLSRVLTAEQLEIAKQIELASAARFRKHLIAKLAIYTFGQAECSFTVQERDKFMTMLDKKLPETTHRDFLKAFNEYFKLDEEDVASALPAEVWRRYEAEFLRRKK